MSYNDTQGPREPIGPLVLRLIIVFIGVFAITAGLYLLLK